MIPEGVHVLCGTCVGEYKGRCGYFESALRRKQVGTPTPAKAEDWPDYEYCCNCGQDSYVAATYVQDGDRPCDGVHSPVED